MNVIIQGRRSRGFTLIELLIVVIIVAILAAIAIPQFSSSTVDAQAAALDANLATVRTALEQYKAQHNGNYPGHVATAKGALCANGTGASGDADSATAMLLQLQNPTDANGANCSVPGGTFKYGPYLRQGLPTEPINNKSDVVVTSAGSAITPAEKTGGWAYDTVSGQFIMNSSLNDSGTTPRAWSAH